MRDPVAYAKRLDDELMREAKRRDELGHNALAHDLRRAASDVARAARLLDASRRERP